MEFKFGNFEPIGQTFRNWSGIITHGKNVYVNVVGGDIYKAIIQ